MLTEYLWVVIPCVTLGCHPHNVGTGYKPARLCPVTGPWDWNEYPRIRWDSNYSGRREDTTCSNCFLTESSGGRGWGKIGFFPSLRVGTPNETLKLFLVDFTLIRIKDFHFPTKRFDWKVILISIRLEKSSIARVIRRFRRYGRCKRVIT